MHVPVLLYESVDALSVRPDGVYVDATYGGGGHSKEILGRLGSKGHLYAFDKDADAKERKLIDPRFTLIHEDFRHMQRFLRLHQITQVDGILADLGMSSFQLDAKDRGFSSRFNAPLDMRMDQSKSKTAASILNTFSEDELVDVFQNYGELRNAKSLSRFITEQRNKPFDMTEDFVQRIEPLIKGNKNRYLAQVFQALRIEVNDELGSLKDLLKQGTDLLNMGGRFSIITFHSLEDRLVKRYFKTGSFERQPETDEFGRWESKLIPLTKKPIEPSEDEVKDNPRSRSAKLRIAEKK